MYINYRCFYVWLPEIFLSLRKGEKRTLDMSKLLTIWNYIRHHKYMITLLVFLVVIGFLDENSLIQRVKHRNEISTLNSEIEKYRKQYEEDTEKLKELTSNPEALEKIAREKYLMKKPNEDVYVFEQ